MFTLKSHAKLNVLLRIASLRATGYHDILSLNCFLDLADTIKIKENRNMMPSLFMDGKYGNKFDNFNETSLQGNLVIKTLEKMYEKYKIPVNLDFHIYKQIPVSAGLGGGSSNAATVINFCNQYFGLKISTEEMIELGLSIGTDIPFCLQDNMAICEGIGEVLTAIQCTQDEETIPVVLVIPKFEISTPIAFRKYDFSNPKNIKSTEIKSIKKTIFSCTSFKEVVEKSLPFGNCLTETAINLRPDIEGIMKIMNEQEGVISVGMSGSGPTCFAVCRTTEDANLAAIKLMQKLKMCDIIPTRILPYINREFIAQSGKPSLESIFYPDSITNNAGWVKIF